jgi:hypothetical protein
MTNDDDTNHSQEHPILSTKLITHLSGIHILPEHPKTKREFLFGVITAMNAIQQIGWIEHTSDWDISYSLTAKDPSYNTDPTHQTINSIRFSNIQDKIPNPSKEHYFSHDILHQETHLTIEGSDDLTDTYFEYQIPINQILTITIDY